MQTRTAERAVRRVFGPELESGRTGDRRESQCDVEIVLRAEVSEDFDVPERDGIEPDVGRNFGTNEAGLQAGVLHDSIRSVRRQRYSGLACARSGPCHRGSRFSVVDEE